jgi:ABC-2 type transport system permease protein
MLWTRTTTVPGTHCSLGTAMLAGMIGMTVRFNGLATLGGILTVEREDGTLLRAKATPNGMTGYLIGKVVTVSGTILISVVTTTLPIGAVLGSLFPSARSSGLLTLAMGGLAAISGVFYPITHLPHWLPWAGEVFPLYWRRSVIPGGTWPPSAC